MRRASTSTRSIFSPACLLGVLAFCLFAGGCLRTNFNLASQRQEYTLTSTDKEVELGRKLARRVEKDLEVVPDEPMQERVRKIGARLAAVCDRKELLYHFTVVSDEDVNAFSLPGGYVFVNDGLIKQTASDDELAAVMAHEIAHIAARHAIHQYETGIGVQLAQLATIATRQAAAARGVSIAAQAASLSYAREDELEADKLGVKYMKAAGFDPKAMLSFLQKLQEINQNKTNYLPRGIVRPQYALTHPYVPERLVAVKEEIYGVADYVDYLNVSR